MVRPGLKNSVQKPSRSVGVTKIAPTSRLLQISFLGAGSCPPNPKPWGQAPTFDIDPRGAALVWLQAIIHFCILCHSASPASQHGEHQLLRALQLGALWQTPSNWISLEAPSATDSSYLSPEAGRSRTRYTPENGPVVAKPTTENRFLH